MLLDSSDRINLKHAIKHRSSIDQVDAAAMISRRRQLHHYNSFSMSYWGMVDLHLLGEASSALKLWLDCSSLVLELFGVLLYTMLFVCGSGSKSHG